MKVVILGKINCPSCTAAKQLCEQKGVDYTYQQMGKDFDLMQFYEIIPRSHKSFPAILINGEFIGGLKELQETLSSDSV
jgi:glutaredoxin